MTDYALSGLSGEFFFTGADATLVYNSGISAITMAEGVNLSDGDEILAKTFPNKWWIGD